MQQDFIMDDNPSQVHGQVLQRIQAHALKLMFQLYEPMTVDEEVMVVGFLLDICKREASKSPAPSWQEIVSVAVGQTLLQYPLNSKSLPGRSSMFGDR